MEQEIFKQIEGYEGYYEISSMGIVKSLTRLVPYNKGIRKLKGQIIKTRINNCGYEEVRLTKKGSTITTFLHCLLAKSFIPNPELKKEVNHKDGDKLNNSVSNLEWVTHSENMLHAYKEGLCKKTGAKVIDMCSGEKYDSMKEAAKATSISYSSCRDYLSGKRKNATCLKLAA